MGVARSKVRARLNEAEATKRSAQSGVMVAHVVKLVWIAGAASRRRRTIRRDLGADGAAVLTAALFSLGGNARLAQAVYLV